MLGIKAIETIYRNYRFRSRSEARWARFMDEAGVAWTYESEGYDLDGVRYLPDFYLPRLDCWLEVKGARPDRRSVEAEKARRLADASGKSVFIISGEIGPGYVIDAYQRGRMAGFVSWRWAVCVRCRMVGIVVSGNGAHLSCQCFQDDESYRSDNWKVIRDALVVARQERFGT